MTQTMHRSKGSLEWAERMASAQGYLAAQYHLFDAIVNGGDESTVCRRLDDVRRANSMFSSAQFLETDNDPTSLARSLDTGIEYLEVVKQLKSNEVRLRDWLDVVDDEEQSVRSFLDARLGSAAAPDCDVFIADGRSEHEISEQLTRRGYKRVIRWGEVCEADERSRLDMAKFREVASRFEALRDIKAGEVWYLNIESPSDDEKLADLVHVELQKLYIYRNTTEHFADRWTLQCLRNLPHFVSRGRDLERLRNVVAGSSAIVVGAGPSVDGAIDWIKSQNPRPVIICAFKALKVLNAAGIVPDLVVCLDPAQHARHMVGVDTSKIPGFIVEFGMSSEVVERADGPLFPYVGNLVSGEVTNCLGLKGELATIASGGTVLSVALQAAVLLGCQQINLVGADFGFPDNRLYAVGAGTGDRFTVDESKKSYVRKPLDAGVRSGALLEVRANDGNTILTSIELTEFRTWVEGFVRVVGEKFPTVQFFNLSPTGAAIDGIPFVPMATHVAQAGAQELVVAIENSSQFPSNFRERVSTRVGRQVARLRELKRLCERGLASDGLSEAKRTSRMLKVVSAARKCPEISGMLNKQLIGIEERRQRTNFEADPRLIELLMTTKGACDQVLDAYTRYQKLVTA